MRSSYDSTEKWGLTPFFTCVRARGFSLAVLLLGVVYAASGQTAKLEKNATAPKLGEWQSLFDGKTLSGWKPANFGGEGQVYIENGHLILEMGTTLTGVTWTGGDLPRMDYEISLEAMKVEGNDFFCGLTFPVADSPCSLIVGGWGGGVVGLSSLDGFDASENETAKIMNFPKGRWYRIQLRVTETKIEAWIDEARVVNVVMTGRRISIRPEVELSKPLGIATWMTKAALRDLKLRRLD